MRGNGQHPDSPREPHNGGAEIAPEDLAALYAAGAMNHDEQERFEAQLTDSQEHRDALRSFDAATAALFASIEPVAPSANIRATLLGKIAQVTAVQGNTQQPHASPPTIRRASADAWRPTPMPGITLRILHIDRAARRFSGLFRMEVGAAYPSHVHEQPEEILVLEGDLDFGSYTLEAGDYLRLEAGSAHSEARTKRGCVCLITAELPESLVA